MAKIIVEPMQFDYAKLKGRTAERGVTDRDVATAAHMNPSTYSQKMNGKGLFTQGQICDICSFLGIEPVDIPAYFFTLVV